MTEPAAGPHDLDIERAVLGALLTWSWVARTVVAECGLRPEHFWRPDHGALLAAVVSLTDRGDPVDVLSVSAQAKVDRARVAALVGDAPAPGSVRGHARRLVDLHGWRRLATAGHALAIAGHQQDPEGVRDAERMMARPDDDRARTFTAGQLASRAYDRYQAGEAETFPLPFRKLNHLTGGGLRRGEVTLLGGHSAHGKSVLVDQILAGCARRGLSVHLVINEMTEAERTDRTVARLSGVEFSKVRRRRLDADDASRVLASLPEIPFGLTEAAGWSAADIARLVRWHRFDVVGIDILHLIEHREERDLAAISQTINQMAKQCDCAVVATVHLNEGRVTVAQRPRPTVGDIRGSGMLKNDADNVLFIHQDQDEDGLTEGAGAVFLAKCRNGQVGAIPVVFHPQKMSFVEEARLEAVS